MCQLIIEMMKNSYRACVYLFLSVLIGISVPVKAQSGDLGGGTWETMQSMNFPRFSPSAGTVNGKIYVMGGIINFGENKVVNVEEYDPATGSWTIKGDMLHPRWGMALVTLNNKIYTIGGYYGSGIYSNDVDEFDPAANTWTTKASLPVCAVDPAAAVVNGKIYAFGGNCAPQGVYEYDPTTNIWGGKAFMVHARYGHSGVMINGKIYAIGGWNSGEGVLNSAEVYDPITNTWSMAASMSVARFSFSAAAINGRIYAIGGSVMDYRTKDPFSSVEEYNPSLNQWRTVTSMPTARLVTAAAVANDKIFVIGGFYPHPTETFLSLVEAYTPPSIYIFDGFFKPVDNPPIMNNVKAGQNIPLKWRVTKDNGDPAIDISSVHVTITALSCDDGTVLDLIDDFEVNGLSLQNLGDGYYHFNWKTPKADASSCISLKLNIGDGIMHEGLFRFK